MRFVLLILAGITAQLAVFSARADETCLQIHDDLNFPGFKAILPTVKEVYEQSGICADFHNIPSLRAEHMLIQGQSDGLLLRDKTFLTSPGKEGIVVSTKTPFMSVTWQLLSLDKHAVNSLAELRDGHLGIGSSAFKRYQGKPPFTDIKLIRFEDRDVSGLIKMLKAGRLRAGILDNVTINKLRTQNTLTGIHTSPAVQKRDVILPLHTRNTYLLSRLETTLSARNH